MDESCFCTVTGFDHVPGNSSLFPLYRCSFPVFLFWGFCWKREIRRIHGIDQRRTKKKKRKKKKKKKKADSSALGGTPSAVQADGGQRQRNYFRPNAPECFPGHFFRPAQQSPRGDPSRTNNLKEKESRHLCSSVAKTRLWGCLWTSPRPSAHRKV